ncbi:membrane-spanning 4-domains subfamily A member 4A-like isoform 4-T5 [Trichechus inunguis]
MSCHFQDLILNYVSYCSTFSASMTTLQGPQNTTPGADSSVSQMGQPAALHLDPWKGMSEKRVLRIFGVVQILIALINLSLGITILCVSLLFDEPAPISVYMGYPVLGSVMFIVSGALSIAAGKRDTECLDECTPGLNCLSSITAAIGIIIIAFSLSSFSFHHFPCDSNPMSENCAINRSILVFIVSGSLSIAAGKRDTECLDQGSLGLNIISSAMATTGIILSLNSFSFSYLHCDYSQTPEICAMNSSMLMHAFPASE